ncbi:MAG: acyl-CoA dehydrogenase family protein, partial [Chloroflexi bacterium]|nr:acyl-CoA dehydrogenase family protein [Chloroflexota bacterium]
AETIWCQCFSEPNAGSDLASLQTRAEDNGDHFLVNGQKIWTSGGHVADWMHLLARTDPHAPKHKGISYFLFSMKTPGIRVEPIRQMDGGHGFNTVFFDNVRLSKDSLLGQLNNGWYVAMTTLNYERANISGAAEALRNLQELVAYCKTTAVNGRRLVDNPLVRHRLAESAIELEIGRLLSYRVLWLQDQGAVPETESSISKNFTYDAVARLAVRAVEILGLRSQLNLGAPQAPLKGLFNWAYLRTGCRAGGGTPEIQRNIIATRGLGLPRS